MGDRTPDNAKKTKEDTHAGGRTDKSIRVIFIPWTKEEDGEFNAKSLQWNEAAVKSGKPANRFTILHWNGKKHPLLEQISKPEHADSVVYIRGHGSPGTPYAQLRDKNNKVIDNLLIKDIIKRLTDSGLSKSFAGVIKFYSCYSGTKLTAESLKTEKKAVEEFNKNLKTAKKSGMITAEQLDEWWKEVPKDGSLAKWGADLLRKAGFKSCIFYGYLGPLSSEYTDDPSDSGKLSKTVVVDPALKNRPEHLDGAYEVKASQGRIQV